MKNKKAIFICGSGGSGKSTIASTCFSEFIIIDLDLIYEEHLVKSNLGLKIKNFTKEESDLALTIFEKSKTINDQRFSKAVELGENIVVDSIGRDPEVILYQRGFLEKMGYETYMIMVYAELDTCIDRVEARNRVYAKNITIDSWYLSYSNISIYNREFKGRFMLIYNDNDNWKDKLKVFIYKKTDKKDII
jgi:adenylate kinase family enzyme